MNFKFKFFPLSNFKFFLGREILYCRWQYAVKKCLNWDNYENYYEELALFSQKEKDPNLPVKKSIPGTLFLTSSFVLLLVSKLLRDRNIF